MKSLFLISEHKVIREHRMNEVNERFCNCRKEVQKWFCKSKGAFGIRSQKKSRILNLYHSKNGEPRKLKKCSCERGKRIESDYSKFKIGLTRNGNSSKKGTEITIGAYCSSQKVDSMSNNSRFCGFESSQNHQIYMHSYFQKQYFLFNFDF